MDTTDRVGASVFACISLIGAGALAYWTSVQQFIGLTMMLTGGAGLVWILGRWAWTRSRGALPNLSGGRLVPLRDALRLAHDQCEEAVGQEGSFHAGFNPGIEAELSPYLEALAARHTIFFATRPGSARRLRVESAPGQFVLIQGTSDLAAADAPRAVLYENVAVRASDLRTAIKQWCDSGLDS